MQTFCTIIDSGYLAYAKALHESLQKFGNNTSLHVLVTGNSAIINAEGLNIVNLTDISGSAFFKEIENKYAHSNKDVFRWALKPVFIGWLLDKGYSKVIYTDPDLYFTGNYFFLFDQLDQYAVLLTPHWADMDIINNPDSVFSILRGGLYNAGFVGVSTKGREAMQWWAALCNNKMGKDTQTGTHDDQKYLDLLPVQFDSVSVLQHQGCNLAGWNIQRCKREMVNGRLKINGKYDPVFIHFAKDTIDNILNRNDALLKPYLDDYIASLKKNGVELVSDMNLLTKFESPVYKLKHRARIRTRLKRFFFRLAEKL